MLVSNTCHGIVDQPQVIGKMMRTGHGKIPKILVLTHTAINHCSHTWYNPTFINCLYVLDPTQMVHDVLIV